MVDLGLSWVRIGEFSWAATEPARGRFEWGWLDEAINALGGAGLKVMLCTPTAAPPKWLVNERPEILPVAADGRVRDFGSRRHCCLSSDAYHEEAARITDAYAARYGRNAHVRAWQIDNEIGDHDSVQSYSRAALAGFRLWLKRRYSTIGNLNRAWGTSFWGMRYDEFDDVGLPVGLVAEPSPTHALDFARYSSDRVALFCEMQAEIVRSRSPGRPICHNFMAGSHAFDHFAAAASLDAAGFDSYPLGELMHGHLDRADKSRWLRTGAPDYQGYYCDLYRGLCGGRLWITEQQPGPVNWAANNPSPADGAVRLWTWIAYAHGADIVLYFRWRQAPFAQEQHHTALHHPDGKPDSAAHEIGRVAAERALVPQSDRGAAPVALVVDYPSRWAQEALPQGDGYSGAAIAADWYRTIRELGIDVDVIGPEHDLSSYALVLVPDMLIATKRFADSLADCDAKLVFGPRSGSKTDDFHLPESGAPGMLRALVDVRVVRVESLPDWHSEPVEYGGTPYEVAGWREVIESGESVVARFAGSYRPGSPAIIENSRTTYLAALPRGDFLADVMSKAAARAGVPVQPTGDGLRLTSRGHVHFAFNFANSPATLPERAGRKFLIGGREVAPVDLAVWIEAQEPAHRSL